MRNRGMLPFQQISPDILHCLLREILTDHSKGVKSARCLKQTVQMYIPAEMLKIYSDECTIAKTRQKLLEENRIYMIEKEDVLKKKLSFGDFYQSSFFLLARSSISNYVRHWLNNG